ncbi:MAG TPA: hypothetical protein VFQ61_30905 [Polyangiaceae bacterium]|nr:hypothetical protein [Polyangiaceae bacterium]
MKWPEAPWTVDRHEPRGVAAIAAALFLLFDRYRDARAVVMEEYND